ncbi:MAG: ATP-dependent RecD-like DNA helicase [candidate division WS1 bacterium]|nr:ATP-dependent RecD-like DNA helicase [candidate division WS1 bacterium]
MAGRAQQSEPELLAGRLERVVYHNPESGWGVLRLAVEGEADLVTAAGAIAAPATGEELRLTGYWEMHPRYGRQFHFEFYELLRPTTPEAIQRYLASGFLKGIGKRMAARIVAQFGEQTLDVLDRRPERLQQVRGIGRKTLPALIQSWKDHEATRNAMLFLFQHGLGASLSQKVIGRYGTRTVEVVSQEPYRLALDISGIGFLTADRLARRAGIPPEDPQRLQAGLLHCLHQALGEGHFFLPLEKLLEETQRLTGMGEERLRHALDLLRDSGRIRTEQGASEMAVYETPLLLLEQELAERLYAQAQITPKLSAHESLSQWLTEREKFSSLELTEEQRAAAQGAMEHGLAVITGGPGTGKTTLVRFLADLARQMGLRLGLAAPTGRAAQRLEQLAGHPASTLHRLLSWDPYRNQFRHGEGNPLAQDWLIIDESSMLDAPLAVNVLRALPAHAALLLVGDADQLPSVGPGRLLQDVIDSGVASIFRLQQIHRQAAGSLIVQSAHRINRGEPPEIPGPRGWNREDCVFIEHEEPAEAADKVIQLVSDGLVRLGYEPEGIQVITSLHRGPIGVQELNRRLQAAVNPPGGKPELLRGETCFRLGDRVLQTVNNYDKNVFNGDIGQVASVDAEEGELTVTYAQGQVAYGRGELDELELAYALTVHKAQGSEFPAVVFVIHSSHYVMLYRNLLYTGVTRAQQMLCLVGDRKGFYKALRTTHHAERYTRLAGRLQGATDPEDA